MAGRLLRASLPGLPMPFQPLLRRVPHGAGLDGGQHGVRPVVCPGVDVGLALVFPDLLLVRLPHGVRHHGQIHAVGSIPPRALWPHFGQARHPRTGNRVAGVVRRGLHDRLLAGPGAAGVGGAALVDGNGRGLEALPHRRPDRVAGDRVRVWRPHEHATGREEEEQGPAGRTAREEPEAGNRQFLAGPGAAGAGHSRGGRWARGGGSRQAPRGVPGEQLHGDAGALPGHRLDAPPGGAPGPGGCVAGAAQGHDAGGGPGRTEAPGAGREPDGDAPRDLGVAPARADLPRARDQPHRLRPAQLVHHAARGPRPRAHLRPPLGPDRGVDRRGLPRPDRPGDRPPARGQPPLPARRLGGLPHGLQDRVRLPQVVGRPHRLRKHHVEQPDRLAADLRLCHRCPAGRQDGAVRDCERHRHALPPPEDADRPAHVGGHPHQGRGRGGKPPGQHAVLHDMGHPPPPGPGAAAPHVPAVPHGH
mmetsp:Transcript_43999/g.124557  ORF Transcript_43999/g.124557 Transcript_43999/m.124557 type:complete len:475 (+) Transcript_43999:485-1909(+)